MATRISNAAAQAACNAIVDLIDAGTPPGLLRIYSGSAPTNVEDSATGDLLAELTFSTTAFGSASDANPGATATAATITGDSSANNSGDAGYFRIVNAAGTAIIQGSVGTSGADLNLTSIAIVATEPVNVTSLTFTVPEIAA